MANYYITCKCDQGRSHTVKIEENPHHMTDAEKIQTTAAVVSAGVTLLSVFASGEISDLDS